MAGTTHFDVTRIEATIRSDGNPVAIRQAFNRIQTEPEFDKFSKALGTLTSALRSSAMTPEQKNEVIDAFRSERSTNRDWQRYAEIQQEFNDLVSPGSNPALQKMHANIEETQRLLNAIGYDVGRPSGVLDANTIEQIQRYERDHRITSPSREDTGISGVTHFYVSDETANALAAEAEYFNKYGAKHDASKKENVSLQPKGGDSVEDVLEEMAGGLGIKEEQREQFYIAMGKCAEEMRKAGVCSEKLKVQVDLDQFNVSPSQMRIMSRARDDYDITP